MRFSGAAAYAAASRTKESISGDKPIISFVVVRRKHKVDRTLGR
jgi:hypothetical protein